jgi:hypothetical protein
MKDFERELERGLHELFDPYLAEQPGPWRTRARTSAPVRVAGGLGGALALKLATGAVIAALAAGAGIEAVNTHSFNPVDWGRAVSRQVQSVQAPAASSPATAHASTSPAGTRQTPAATPIPGAPAVSPPAVGPLPLPRVSPITLPTVKPTSLPTIP